MRLLAGAETLVQRAEGIARRTRLAERHVIQAVDEVAGGKRDSLAVHDADDRGGIKPDRREREIALHLVLAYNGRRQSA